jgi:hypothetical protein
MSKNESTAKTAPAPAAASASAPAAATSATAANATKKFDPATAKVVKLLTLPLIKLRAGLTVYIKPLEPMFQAKPQKNVKEDDDAAKKPPTLMHVMDLETGELAQIIPGTILADIFNDDYPNQTYVGRGFKIVVGEQKAVQGGGGKRYNQYTVAEIELPA